MNNFYINHDKFQDYSNKATDWFIKSWKFKIDSDEWKICRLKKAIYEKKATEHLKLASEYLNEQL